MTEPFKIKGTLTTLSISRLSIIIDKGHLKINGTNAIQQYDNFIRKMDMLIDEHDPYNTEEPIE